LLLLLQRSCHPPSPGEEVEMFQWISSLWLGGAAAEPGSDLFHPNQPTHEDPHHPHRELEEFDAKFEKATGLIAQLDGMVSRMEIKQTGGGKRGSVQRVSRTPTTTSKRMSSPSGGPTLITLPPGPRNQPIVNNGMVLMPGEKAWQPLSAQRGARALKEEDYILDPHGDWVQKDEAPVEPTENERSRPRMFLIRFLNSRSISKKTVGTNVLYNGKWQNTEQDDFDYGQFPDEEELSNLSQDKFLPLNEFQVDEDECYRREKMHLEEMQNWISCEKDPQRFLVDGLRQMYIIRVVKQVNRGQGIKGNSSPLAPQVPLNAQQPKAPTPKHIEKFKDHDDDDFATGIECGADKPITPRNRPSAEVEDDYGDSSADSVEKSPGLPARKAEKYATSPAKAFRGTEIGDSDGDDEDWESPRPKQPTREEESANDADDQDSGSNFDLDETSSGANPKMNSSLLGDLVIGDSDGDDEEEEAGGEQPQNLADGHTSRHTVGGLVNGDGEGGGMDTRQSHDHVPTEWENGDNEGGTEDEDEEEAFSELPKKGRKKPVPSEGEFL